MWGIFSWLTSSRLNASIDFSPQPILKYLSEAIRPIYARPGPYIELCTPNLSSLRCILSYIIEYYALWWCILLLYAASIVYLRPTDMAEAQILARYSRVLHNHIHTNARIDFVAWTNTRIREYILVKHSRQDLQKQVILHIFPLADRKAKASKLI